MTLLVYGLYGPSAAIDAGVGTIIALLADDVRPRRGKFSHLVAAPLLGIPLFLLVQLLRVHPVELGLFLVPATFVVFLSTAWGRRGMPIAGAVMLAMFFAMAPEPVDDAHAALLRTLWCAVGAGLYVVYSMVSNALLNGRYRGQVMADLLFSTAALLCQHAARIAGTDGPAGTGNDRRALGAILRGQAALSDQLQAARDLILERPSTPRHQRLAGMLVEVLELRDRMIAGDLGAERARYCGEPAAGRFTSMLCDMAGDVGRIADALLIGRVPTPARDHRPELESLRQSAREGAGAADANPDAMTHAALMHSVSVRIGDLNTEVLQLAALARGEAEPNLAAVRSGWQLFTSPAHWTWRPLLRLHWRQPALRHALRAALAVGFGFALAQVVPWSSRDYWILLTISVVLRGSLAQTLTRRNERVIGTVVGSLLAVLLLALRPPIGLLLLAVIVAQGVAHAFVVRRYVVTAVAASVLGLVMTGLLRAGSSPTFDFITRLGDTLLGAAIAWGFSYVLPAWERGQLATLVQRACRAMARHARQSLALAAVGDVTGQPELEWRLARREAYDVLSALVQATDRALAEPRAVRPPVAALERLQGHSYQLLGQLSAIQSILLLRRERLDMEVASRSIDTAMELIATRLDLARVCTMPAPTAAADESNAPGLRAVPEDLPDPFLSDSTPWLLRRLHLAAGLASRVRTDTERVLAAVSADPGALAGNTGSGRKSPDPGEQA
ncbi:MAG TPA: FUSC family protein [Rhodanobacteraceae bacterium]|nr:FUSC family protein [Rhodanobacteraceae bacterium]